MNAYIDPSDEEALRLLMQPMGNEEPWGLRRIANQVLHHAQRLALYLGGLRAQLDDRAVLVAFIISVCALAALMPWLTEGQATRPPIAAESSERKRASVLPVRVQRQSGHSRVVGRSGSTVKKSRTKRSARRTTAASRLRAARQRSYRAWQRKMRLRKERAKRRAAARSRRATAGASRKAAAGASSKGSGSTKGSSKAIAGATGSSSSTAAPGKGRVVKVGGVKILVK